MRHIRTRRHFRITLIALLAVCFVLFIESRMGALVPEIKNFAESKIAETFGGKIKISIGDIDGGLIRPFVFNNIRIKDGDASALLSSLVIKSIRTDYRVWDALPKRSGFLSIFYHKPVAYIDFTMQGREISGFFKLEGTAKDAKVDGYVMLPGRGRVEFTGGIKEGTFTAEVKSASGALKAEGSMAEDGSLKINFNARHLKLASYDIAFEGEMTSAAKGSGAVEGEIAIKNFILNYKPFLDVKGSYRISGGLLEMPGIDIGEAFHISGKALLMAPYNMDIVMAVNNVSLSWLFPALGFQDAVAILSGTMNGKFALKGPLANPRSSTHLEIRKGAMATLDFDLLTAHIKGDGPILKIEDSRITRTSGYFVLAGEMDLKRMGKANFFDHIKLVSDDRAITWDSWQSAKRFDIEEVRMSKRLNEDISVDFKKFVAEEKIDESLHEKDSVGLEYKLNPHESLKMVLGQQENDFMGLEHKDKF